MSFLPGSTILRFHRRHDMADRTPIFVAAIGLIGVVTAAAIANPRNVRELFGVGGAKPAAADAEVRRDDAPKDATATTPASRPTTR